MGLRARSSGRCAFAVSPKTYDSALFSRAIESAIRSLRYGLASAEGLEATARQRGRRIVAKQEQVAKAPVKMMVPTGTLCSGVLVVIAIVAITLFRPKIQELWDAIANGINGL